MKRGYAKRLVRQLFGCSLIAIDLCPIHDDLQAFAIRDVGATAIQCISEHVENLR